MSEAEKTERPERSGRRGAGILLVVLVLVNSVAIWGQAGWALEHLVPQMLPAELAADLRIGYVTALLLAAALELTGVFLSVQADESDRKHLPSGGTRLLSYSAGIMSGALNFSHWDGTAAKISLGLLSAISPFLWGIYSRVRRGEQVAPSRRFWHPIKSISLIREMAWEGIVTEEEAILRRKEQKIAPAAPLRVSASVAPEELEEMFLPLEQEKVLEIAPTSSAPVSPASPRAPRVSWDAPKVVQMILDGAKNPDIIAATQVPMSSLGRLRKVTNLLRADRSTPIDSRAEKVLPEYVDMIRRALAPN